MSKKQYRQGDVLMNEVSELPKGAKKLRHRTVATGEHTGHHHTFKKGTKLYEDEGGTLFAKVAKPTVLEHQTHPEIIVAPGTYEYIPQREYSPKGNHNIKDVPDLD